MTHDSFAVSKGVKRGVRAGERAEAPDPPGRRRERDAEPRAPHGRRPAGRRHLRDRRQHPLARARRRPARGVPLPELSRSSRTSPPPDSHVTPIDHGEVCLNVDRGWFASHRIAPPTSARRPRPRRATATCSSSRTPRRPRPGLAFLLATVATFGDRWEAYWRGLRANGVLAVDGWEEAYTQQFSGAAGSPGKRPIVVSYASSPAAEVIFASKPLATAPTAAVEDGCYRQVEYAGVLRGAHERGRARGS